MKYSILFILMLYCVFLKAQSIDSAEYFFDNDPGISNGFSLSVNTNTGQISQTYNIDISGLSNGFHTLYIRTINNESNWSLYDRSTFYIATFPSGQDIIAAEYYFNDNNGNGLGVGEGINLDIEPEQPMVSQTFMISTTGLGEGFHDLHIRTLSTDGTWSLYDRQIIYIKDFSDIPTDVANAEYFIDQDMGFGLGTPITITGSPQVFNFNTEGLAEGDHSFCIRVQNSAGEWSLYCCATFNIDSNLGIEDSLYKAVQVSPNSFTNIVNIDTSRAIKFQNISVFNITGREVYTTTEDLRTLDLEYLESGIYILSLVTENEKATFKIIKQ